MEIGESWPWTVFHCLHMRLRLEADCDCMLTPGNTWQKSWPLTSEFVRIIHVLQMLFSNIHRLRSLIRFTHTACQQRVQFRFGWSVNSVVRSLQLQCNFVVSSSNLPITLSLPDCATASKTFVVNMTAWIHLLSSRHLFLSSHTVQKACLQIVVTTTVNSDSESVEVSEKKGLLFWLLKVAAVTPFYSLMTGSSKGRKKEWWCLFVYVVFLSKKEYMYALVVGPEFWIFLSLHSILMCDFQTSVWNDSFLFSSCCLSLSSSHIHTHIQDQQDVNVFLPFTPSRASHCCDSRTRISSCPVVPFDASLFSPSTTSYTAVVWIRNVLICACDRCMCEFREKGVVDRNER